MVDTVQRLKSEAVEVSELAITIRNAGIAGAGGAGFPTYAKWERVNEVDALLMNHQESEPNYYIDKWLGKERATELAALFEALLDTTLDLIVVGAKQTDRTPWLHELESATGASIVQPTDLPIDPESESGVVIAYTEDQYQYGMENVLLHQIANVIIGQDLPMDHGWIVQNTETMTAIHDALASGSSMTNTLVHVDGQVPRHRFLEVPIGTPASELLMAAGIEDGSVPNGATLADGGPRWCFEIEQSPDSFGVRKRTNCLLALKESTMQEGTLGDGRIDVREEADWTEGEQERNPTEALNPEIVHIPLRSNPNFAGLVKRSKPIVESGDTVDAGEMIAVPASDGISNAQHASVSGTVRSIEESHITIQRDPSWTMRSTTISQETTDRLYWTWCSSCGTYVIPEGDISDPTEYVCSDCE